MASGNSLVAWSPVSARPPSSNAATLDRRNGRPLLAFDQTTQEATYFAGVLPRHYGGGGVTVSLHWASASATTGTVGWDVAIERIGEGVQDVDADGFATAKTVTAVNVPATSGLIEITSVAFTNGAEMDSLAVGEMFRIRIRRDVANDTLAEDAQLFAVEMIET